MDGCTVCGGELESILFEVKAEVLSPEDKMAAYREYVKTRWIALGTYETFHLDSCTGCGIYYGRYMRRAMESVDNEYEEYVVTKEQYRECLTAIAFCTADDPAADERIQSSDPRFRRPQSSLHWCPVHEWFNAFRDELIRDQKLIWIRNSDLNDKTVNTELFKQLQIAFGTPPAM